MHDRNRQGADAGVSAPCLFFLNNPFGDIFPEHLNQIVVEQQAEYGTDYGNHEGAELVLALDAKHTGYETADNTAYDTDKDIPIPFVT